MLVVSKSFTVWCLTGQYAGCSLNPSGLHNSRHAIAFFGLGTSLFQPHAGLQSPGISSHARFHTVTSCRLVKTSGTSSLTIGMPEWESPDSALKCTMKGIIQNSGEFRRSRRGYYKPAGGDFSAKGRWRGHLCVFRCRSKSRPLDMSISPLVVPHFQGISSIACGPVLGMAFVRFSVS